MSIVLVFILSIGWALLLALVSRYLAHDCTLCALEESAAQDIPSSLRSSINDTSLTSPFSLVEQCLIVTSVCALTYLYVSPITLPYAYAYTLFFSALIVSIYTDLETMMLSRYATLLPIPLGLLASYCHWIPVSLLQSATGALFGFSVLFIIGKLFRFWTGKDGIGEGDFELLAAIGTWTGLIGCWTIITASSIAGVIWGLCYMVIMRHKGNLMMPFAPFLAITTIAYVFVQPYVIEAFYKIVLCRC